MLIASLSRRACAWLLGACALPALAQSGAADPRASVPATTYRSAFGYRPEAAPGTTPDQAWVRNNATVGAINSMSLTMKGMHGADDPHAGSHAAHPVQAAPAPASGPLPAPASGKGSPAADHPHHHQEPR